MRINAALCLLAVLMFACEDGPKQIFQPNEADNLSQQNGYGTGSTWTQEGDKAFESDDVAGDNAGRARFCDEAMTSELIQWMVTQPLIPDVSGGGIPLWSADGGPIHVDSLLGVPNERAEDGTWDPVKFCDPWYTYSNALTWGPLDDIIVFFEPDTRLVTDIQVIGQYLGTLSGTTTQDNAQVEVSMQLMERLSIGGQELDIYPDWVKHETVTTMYGMLRETFFGDSALPAGFDCVSAKLCDVIYSLGDPTQPQTTYVLFQDSGVIIGFSEDGYLQFVDIEMVRIAPFEVSAAIDFGDVDAVAPGMVSGNALLPDCQLNLNAGMTWSQFKQACVNEQTLNRVNYVVHTQRDGVDAEFNGVTLSFLRRTSEHGVFPDGSAPGETDELYGLAFSRSLNATIAEYVPHKIALSYKARLEARLASALSADAPEDHPFKAGNYAVTIPYADAEQTMPLLSEDPQRIGELSYEGVSWVPEVVEDVQWTYQSMSPAYKAMVDDAILNEVFLIEPFVDAVLGALTHGASDYVDTFKAFRTTDTRMWSIGSAHFIMNGAPYRLMVQYSLYYGAVTYVTVDRGYSEVDTLLNKVSTWLSDTYGLPATPYYELWMSESWLSGYNPFALGGNAIAVAEADRQLDTLTVGLMDVDTFWEDEQQSSTMVVPGTPVADDTGFSRQIQGERFEFIPADKVYLYGKENTMLFYVEPDGTIGRVVQPTFKGQMSLCGGLDISYGDNVREQLMAWEQAMGPEAYRDCEVVFNYSENGNVLDSVVSLRNRVSFTTIDGRAVTAAIWR